MAAKLKFAGIDDEVFDKAIAVAVSGLNDEGTPARLAEYYDRNTNYAGATFAGLQPASASEITATDLLAVTTLGVSIGDHAIRRFLEDDQTRHDVSAALAALPEKPLEEVTDDEFVPMAELYELVKSTLASPDAKTFNSWVTASKIVARKRPDLFPVRDSVVCTNLGIMKLNYYLSDWRVFRCLMRESEVTSLLSRLPERINTRRGERAVDFATETPLRLLDAALWMS